MPQLVGLGEQYGPTEEEKANALPDLRSIHTYGQGSVKVGKGAFGEPMVDPNSPYPIGDTKPAGSNYTRTLVIPALKTEKTAWIQEELGDLLSAGLLTTAIYTVNDRHAPLHPIKNKGHEVMVYLSYIIDAYDRLADISIFMHAHRTAAHNNELLDNDAALMIRHLRPERVVREGYMNLRCHWDTRCPEWLRPGTVTPNPGKQEEALIADAWTQLFPLDAVPSVLAQPCCAQFAVSRERILATPKMRYITMRDWVIRTELSDYLSGRVFEYLWQYVFTGTPVHCPSMLACYCDGYGLCFDGMESFNQWFELRDEHAELEVVLRAWRVKAEKIEMLKAESREGQVGEEALLELPEVGGDERLERRIAEVWGEMVEGKERAFERGREPGVRAHAVEAWAGAAS